jgi:hypothetical protein
MAEPIKIPAGFHEDEPQWLAHLGKEELVYFLLNVGDADAQVLLLPEVDEPGHPQDGRRQAIVVDAALRGKVPSLLTALAEKGLLPKDPSAPPESVKLGADSIALVAASHPHQDHIGALDEVLRTFDGAVTEFWDSGYFHTLPAYHRLMKQVENQTDLVYSQPTSGLRRWIGNVMVTVLAPSVQLRNRYDTYGVDVNDASLTLKLEWPAARVVKDETGRRVASPKTTSLVLGADAQTLSWSYVLADFPYLAASSSEAAKAIKAATGSDPLAADVFKISHHGSKHGVNLELVERIGPSFTLISSVGTGGSYGFPHSVAQELIREALNPSTVSGKPHPVDYELRIFYTADREEGTPPQALGSMALVGGEGTPRLYRFGDTPTQAVELGGARRWKGTHV